MYSKLQCKSTRVSHISLKRLLYNKMWNSIRFDYSSSILSFVFVITGWRSTINKLLLQEYVNNNGHILHFSNIPQQFDSPALMISLFKKCKENNNVTLVNHERTWGCKRRGRCPARPLRSIHWKRSTHFTTPSWVLIMSHERNYYGTNVSTLWLEYSTKLNSPINFGLEKLTIFWLKIALYCKLGII